MAIVLFWIDGEGRADHEVFGQDRLTDALKAAEVRRKGGMRHVCISTELDSSVGAPGVNAVDARTLPSGERYVWTKAHRGAGPTKD